MTLRLGKMASQQTELFIHMILEHGASEANRSITMMESNNVHQRMGRKQQVDPYFGWEDRHRAQLIRMQMNPSRGADAESTSQLEALLKGYQCSSSDSRYDLSDVVSSMERSAIPRIPPRRLSVCAEGLLDHRLESHEQHDMWYLEWQFYIAIRAKMCSFKQG